MMLLKQTLSFAQDLLDDVFEEPHQEDSSVKGVASIFFLRQNEHNEIALNHESMGSRISNSKSA